MENEQDLCNLDEMCIKVRLYHLLHGNEYTRCALLWALASSCL